ncbi:MAG: MATE family efflux transporter, partial [Comamonadaceae bacterium]
TTVVQILTFAVYWRAVRRDPVLKDLLSLAFWRARPETAVQIAKLGWPISLTYGLEASITSVASVVIGTFGPVALAASNVVHQLAKIVYQINVGISHGSSILVSRAMGQGHIESLGKIARASMVICFVPMAAIGIGYLCLPQLVLWPFLRGSASTSIFSTAVPLLWLAVAYQFLAAAQNIFIGLLRGLGNTSSGLLNTLVGYWLIGVPAILICSEHLGWEERGVWLGLCFAFGATSLLLGRRFHTELDQLSRAR